MNTNNMKEFNIEKAQDYYDKLRCRIDKYIKSGVPSKYHYTIPYLFLLPDVLVLLIRLFKDARIKGSDKALIIAGIAYIVAPFDIIPDIALPFGVLDDLSIGFFVLDKLLLNTDEDILKDNFSGDGSVVRFIRNGYLIAKNILPPFKRRKVSNLFKDIISKRVK